MSKWLKVVRQNVSKTYLNRLNESASKEDGRLRRYFRTFGDTYNPQDELSPQPVI
jgi:hypothetical protein